MGLALKVGVTLPAVSGWERNLYRPRRPIAQLLDDTLRGEGAILAAFEYAPLPGPGKTGRPEVVPEDRMQRLEARVAELSDRLDAVQETMQENLSRR